MNVPGEKKKEMGFTVDSPEDHNLKPKMDDDDDDDEDDNRYLDA